MHITPIHPAGHRTRHLTLYAVCRIPGCRNARLTVPVEFPYLDGLCADCQQEAADKVPQHASLLRCAQAPTKPCWTVADGVSTWQTIRPFLPRLLLGLLMAGSGFVGIALALSILAAAQR